MSINCTLYKDEKDEKILHVYANRFNYLILTFFHFSFGFKFILSFKKRSNKDEKCVLISKIYILYSFLVARLTTSLNFAEQRVKETMEHDEEKIDK